MSANRPEIAVLERRKKPADDHGGLPFNPGWWVEGGGGLADYVIDAAGSKWEVLGPTGPATTPQALLHEVCIERVRAHQKHGDTSMESSPASDPVGRRYRVLAEEVGEVAKEFNDAEHDGRPVDLTKLRKELIQVAAMAIAWADACCQSGGSREPGDMGT